uniref:RING-type E3 ubiquitin transferase n=1 Tax=Accipiter nisus TaxID=211598 RepID=A0A8B9MF30_9AVES
ADEQPAECSQCPICLGCIEDAAYMVVCLQPFCFACIKDWARSRARCPLCRQPFDLLMHSVQADNDYKEYVVPFQQLSTMQPLTHFPHPVGWGRKSEKKK